MRLVRKTNIFIGAVAAVLIVANVGVLWFAIVPSFARLEKESAEADIQRVVARINAEGENLVTTGADWGVWDETYDFLSGDNNEYADENFYLEAWQNLDVDFAYFATASGDVSYRAAFSDLDSGEEADLEFAPSSAVGDDHSLMLSVATSEPVFGVVSTAFGPLLVAAHPVLRNDASGPPSGFVAFGRFLNGDRLDQFRGEVNVDFDVLPYSESGWTAMAGATVGNTGDVLVETEPAGTVRRGLATINSPSGEPSLIVESRSPRYISNLGRHTVNVSIVTMVIVSALTLIAMAFGMNRLVVRPLHNLAESMRRITKTGDMAERTNFQRSDELGTVSKSFDDMLAELASVRERLLEQSFYAGRADQTSAAMHNIRNALNPVGFTAWKVGELIKDSSAARVSKAVEGLKDPAIDDARRAKFVEYLDGVGTSLQSERTEIQTLVDAIATQSREIEQILNSLSTPLEMNQTIGPIDVMSVVTELDATARSRKDVDISFSVEGTVAKIEANRVILSQILANIVTNGRESIEAAGKSEGSISVRCVETLDEGRRYAEITIVDDGEGFDEPKRKRLFERGFSTRKQKPGGLGLHWCANSVVAIGGSIDAHSRGIGHGARFTIKFPIAEMAEEAAA